MLIDISSPDAFTEGPLAPKLEVRHLLTLLAVSELGTFGRAASALGYTQSAVSQQVAALERAVGTPIFDRPGGPRPVQLTEAGRVLLVHAQRVVDQVRSAEAEVRAIASGETGTLRVGLFQSVGTKVLPQLLRRFHARRPGIEVQLRESHDQETLVRLLATNDIDVTFVQLPLADELPLPIEHLEIFEDPLFLLAPAGSPEGTAGRVSIDTVATLPLIGGRNPACQLPALRCFAGRRAPEFVFQSDDNPTIQGLVGAGVGYYLGPWLTLDPDDPATVIVEVDPTPAPRRIALAWHGGIRSPASLREFVDTATEVCADLAATTALAAPA